MSKVTLPEVNFFYGLPSKEHLESLKEEIKKDPKCTLAFIEDDLSFYLANKSLIDHPQIHVYFVANPQEDLWQIVQRYSFYIKIVMTPQNHHKSSDQCKTFCSFLMEVVQAADAASSLYQDFGVRCLKNTLKNFLTVSRAHSFEKLKDIYKGVPALICGSGSSLLEQADLIKKYGSKMLIFAGGSTLSLLHQQKITPDFAAAIDPGPVDRSLCVFPSLPFFYQTQVDPHWFKGRTGPLIWVKDSGHFHIEKWLCEQLKVPHFVFDGGWTVGTFLTAIVTYLGCDPILFVGMDLCGKQKKGEDEWFSIKNDEGKACITKRDWHLAADWLKRWTHNHPERKWLNLSNGLDIGALKTKNLPELPELEAIKKQVDQLFRDQDGFLPNKELSAALTDIRSSFIKVLELTQRLIQELEQAYPKVPDGKVALYEVELQEEVAYTHFIEINIKMWEALWRQQIDPAVPEIYGFQLYKWIWMQRLCQSILEDKI